MDEHQSSGHKARDPDDEADLAVDSEREPEGEQHQPHSHDHQESLHKATATSTWAS